MSAIECTTAGVKDMADGSLRITLEFEPRHAKDAFSLFGARGTSCAIVALTEEAAKQSAQAETIGSSTWNINGDPDKYLSEKPKGGQLAKLAGMWCQDENFYNFILPIYDKYLGGDGSGCGDVDWPIVATEFSRHAILVLCDIESRAELDHNPEAAAKFHKLIREPFSEYLKSHE